MAETIILYHLDTKEQLKENIELKNRNFFSQTDSISQGVKEMFGPSINQYFAKVLNLNLVNIPPDNIVTLINEIIFESVRNQLYPSLPSRFSSLFAFSRENLLDHLKCFGCDLQKANIYELEVDNNSIHRADINWLDHTRTPSAGIYNAIQYWKGTPSDGEYKNTPRWEYIIPFPVKIGRKVKVSISLEPFNDNISTSPTKNHAGE